MYALARPLLFCLDAERAHDLALKSIDLAHRSGLVPLIASTAAPLPIEVFGLRFENPVGLAAGLDKNGAHVDALAALGFGFIEVGTTTPRPQPGNPKPRMFRLPECDAVINRLGFNNAGVDVLVANIERANYRGVLGINIGKNKETPNDRAVDDYLYCFERVFARASYVTINISSPNTEGLRDLQHAESLRLLVGALGEAQQRLAAHHGKRTPLLLKIAPDLDGAQMDDIAAVLRDGAIDGLICTNTTIDRDAVSGHRHADEAGGLSGRPVFAKSTAILRAMRERLDDRMPLIGVGGILKGADALAKIDAGATLVQVYTGMIYRGPQLIQECVEALRKRVAESAA